MALGAVRVYDRGGGRVDSGGTDVQGAVVRLRVSGLAKGSYVVTWRVTSADTHPVAGAFTFQIGTAGNASSPAARNLAARLLAQQGGDPAVGAAYGVTRWLVFAGLALLLGAAVFALAVWPGARSSATGPPTGRRRLARARRGNRSRACFCTARTPPAWGSAT